MGARLVFHCLLELCRQGARGVVQHAVLMGCPVSRGRVAEGVQAGGFGGALRLVPDLGAPQAERVGRHPHCTLPTAPVRLQRTACCRWAQRSCGGAWLAEPWPAA